MKLRRTQRRDKRKRREVGAWSAERCGLRSGLPEWLSSIIVTRYRTTHRVPHRSFQLSSFALGYWLIFNVSRALPRTIRRIYRRARAVSISDRFFRPLRRRQRSLFNLRDLDAAIQIWDAKAYHSCFASFAAKDGICMCARYLQSERKREKRTKRGIRFIRCTVHLLIIFIIIIIEWAC
jgi:hypothetical protein